MVIVLPAIVTDVSAGGLVYFWAKLRLAVMARAVQIKTDLVMGLSP
jgi:hypothetical protein